MAMSLRMSGEDLLDMETSIFPSLIFLFTSCVLCLIIGILIGTYSISSASLIKLASIAGQSSPKYAISTTLNEKTQGQLEEGNNRSNSVIKAVSTTSLQVNRNDTKVSRKQPAHIAVIMDGNRRYGRLKHSDSLQGHMAGGQKLIDFIQWCMAENVNMLTVYAFSSENWNRDPAEIAALMNVFIKHAQQLEKESASKNIHVKVLITERTKLPSHVAEAIDKLEQTTKNCTGFHLNICLSYGSRSEITLACKNIANQVVNNSIQIDDINEQTISDNLLTGGLPDPDILIRTSGEFRLSNFLLYQLAYTEMFFLDKFWPELTQEDLQQVIDKYCGRDRRFGK